MLGLALVAPIGVAIMGIVLDIPQLTIGGFVFAGIVFVASILRRI